MESLNLTPEIVGRRYPLKRNYVSMTWVRDYVRCVNPNGEGEGADNLDDSFVPEFFMPALRDGPFEIFNELGVELKRLLHVAQEYTYHCPLRGNDWVVSETVVSDLKEKSSKLGSIYIMDLSSKFFQNDELCVESLMRVFVRRA